MRNRAFFRGLFLVAALYDLILGVVFLFLHRWAYGLLGVPFPTEVAYLHAAAAFVLVQGIMYVFVYRNMERNVDLVRVGAIYKCMYAAVSLYHWGMGTLPHPVFALFGLLDILFLGCFLYFLGAAREVEEATVA